MPGGAPVVKVDYKGNDYRGFIFIVHEEHGLLLLKCTRKKNKPPHWQVPGGHVDAPEFVKAAAQVGDDRDAQLLLACKMGAARELYEETGMDLRSKLDRFEPAALRPSSENKTDKKGNSVLNNEYKKRLFYFLSVSDDDFQTDRGVEPLGTEGKHLKLQLSVEHSGWMFQPEPSESAELLKLHSGGKVTEALLMAKEKDNNNNAMGANKQQERGGAEAGPPVDAIQTTSPSTATAVEPPGDVENAVIHMKRSDSEEAVAPERSAVSSLDGSTMSGTGRRRGKRDRDKSKPIIDSVVDLIVPPKPEKKNMFCCFKFC